LVLFAGLVMWVDVAHAGRAYAVYGGIYIAASLLWLWADEGRIAHRWDLIGAGVALAGALIILYMPRTACVPPQTRARYQFCLKRRPNC
jgi:small multidrug resistance family-3 protein